MIQRMSTERAVSEINNLLGSALDLVDNLVEESTSTGKEVGEVTITIQVDESGSSVSLARIYLPTQPGGEYII